jgi:hypothetical protein
MQSLNGVVAMLYYGTALVAESFYVRALQIRFVAPLLFVG